MTSTLHILLDSEAPLRIEAGELIVESGVVWLTERGQSADLFLRPGQRHVVRPSRLVVVQAMQADTRIRLAPQPRFAGLPEWLAALFRWSATRAHTLNVGHTADA